MAKTRRAIQNQTNRTLDRGDLGALLGFAATHSEQSVCRKTRAYAGGLPIDIAQAKLDLNGPNAVSETVENPTVIRFLKCFASPFTLILLALAAISYITNVVLAPSGEQDPTTVIIIAIMVLISGIIDFVQSSRGASAAAALLQMVTATTRVRRRPINFDDFEVSHTETPHDDSATDGASHASTDTADTSNAGSSFDKEIPFADVVVGDLVLLASGDMVPADCRVLDAKDLFVNETALTGESEPVEKFPTVVHARRRADGTRYPLSLSECTNLLFAGTTVQSGSATAVVVATGDDTYVGRMSALLRQPATKTSFDVGLASVSKVLVAFMLVMCPIVFIVNGVMKGAWLDALLFSVSVAVGITPQMLPVIVTTCLSRGATQMAKQDVIVKTPSAIQNLGAIDILCTDKTGTITADEVILERHLNVLGEEDEYVLRYAFLNSYFQTGLRNLIDSAIINATGQLTDINNLINSYTKVDEVPFDFERRRMSVVVEDVTNNTHMITKGAVEEILAVCTSVNFKTHISPLTNAQRQDILRRVHDLNHEGMRVVAVLATWHFLILPKQAPRKQSKNLARRASASRYLPETTKALLPPFAKKWASPLTHFFWERKLKTFPKMPCANA